MGERKNSDFELDPRSARSDQLPEDARAEQVAEDNPDGDDGAED